MAMQRVHSEASVFQLEQFSQLSMCQMVTKALCFDVLALLLEGTGSSHPAVSSACALLALVQNLMPMPEAPALVMVTHGACLPLVHRESLSPVYGGACHGGAWGFGRTLRLERAAQCTA